MIEIGTPCRETISLIYNLVRVSILSITRMGMKCADLVVYYTLCFQVLTERPRAKNEGPIVTVAKHSTVTLLPTSVVRSSGELAASVEREFVGDASVGDGGDQGFDSVVGQEIVEPSVPITEPVEATVPKPKRSKKKRVIYDNEGLHVAPHPPKRLRTDYGTAGGSVTCNNSYFLSMNGFI
ncbi:hypothetical protein Tco_0413993 [Tanacetum coccineum]